MVLNVIKILLSIFFVLHLSHGVSQVQPNKTKESNLDSLSVNRDELLPMDKQVTDTIMQKERLQDVLAYDSDDQYHDIKNQLTFLISKAEVNYTDLKITADYIEINWETGEIYAVGKQDSLGNLLEPSTFRQGNKEIEYNSFTYNINTGQGKAFNVRSEESMGVDRGVVVAAVVKQYNDSIAGMRKIAYTTDEYFINRKDSIADYYLQANVAKFIQGEKKRVITGPIVMKIYEVPTPLALPFAFLPMSDTKSAGFLLPSFGETAEQGFYLQGGGFYIPFGDYLDLAVTADIYTRGSLGLHADSQYKKRYAFAGNINLDWEKKVNGIKGLSNYNRNTLYRILWTHRQDPKANPNLIFNSSINYSSTQFYRNGINNNRLFNGEALTNQINSSISLSKTFPDSPFSAQLTLRHSQNNSTLADVNPISFTLPDLTVNMTSIFPFAPKSGTKKGLIEKLRMSYAFNLKNTLTTNEDDVFTRDMFDDMQTGAKNTLGLSTGINVFNYFNWNMNASYNEVWTLNSIEKLYDSIEDKIINKDIKGFRSFRTFRLGTDLQTTLYGMKVFGNEDDDKWIKAIRHTVIPSIGFSFSPDFSDDLFGYYDVYRDDFGRKQIYTPFEGGIFGSPGRGLQTNLNYSIRNNLEMKVRSKNDSIGVNKIKIFEYLNINGSYNIAADSLQFSPIRIAGATNLLKNKLKITFGAQLDPYKTIVNEANPNGLRVNDLQIPALQNFDASVNYSLNNSTFGERKLDYPRRGVIRYENFYYDDKGYAQYEIPWSLDIGYKYSKNLASVQNINSVSTLRLAGRISPTPYWNLSTSTSIDLNTGEFAYPNIAISRDLRSFLINFSWIPTGPYKSWNFFIGIKASFLSDALKYEERSFN